MDKVEFGNFLKEIGFGKIRMLGSYAIDISSNNMVYVRRIIVTISGDLISASISQINPLMSSGENLFYYSLSTFGHHDKSPFVIYLSKFFDNPPDKFKPYLRDNKINSILE